MRSEAGCVGGGGEAAAAGWCDARGQPHKLSSSGWCYRTPWQQLAVTMHPPAVPVKAGTSVDPYSRDSSSASSALSRSHHSFAARAGSRGQAGWGSASM